MTSENRSSFGIISGKNIVAPFCGHVYILFRRPSLGPAGKLTVIHQIPCMDVCG